MALVAAIAAGCGSSSSSSGSRQPRAAVPRLCRCSRPVQRGNLVLSATGSVKLVLAKGKTEVVATVARQFACRRRHGADGNPDLLSRRDGRAEQPERHAFPPAAAPSAAPFGQAGKAGKAASRRRLRRGRRSRARHARHGNRREDQRRRLRNGNDRGQEAACQCQRQVGRLATIQTKVLASNVIVIPTAAIKGSGSSATVQVLAGGKTSTGLVVVGQQAGTSRRSSPGSLSARTSSGHDRSSAAASSAAAAAARSPVRVSRPRRRFRQ